MADLTIVLGNKNYSSWSLRPWLALAHTGEAFDEIVIPLDQPSTKREIARHSPAGRVPVLKHHGLTIWDSLAICEYLAETFPEARLWPEDQDARARARAVAAEMHSGFADLRTTCTMNIRASRPKELTPGAQADAERIRALWRECLDRSGGPFLFGRFSIADAMYAPVVTRFRTYGVKLDGKEVAYAETILAFPPMQQWIAAAQAETWTIGKYDQE